MEYTVVRAYLFTTDSREHEATQLEIEVNKMIKKGWKPVGGIAVLRGSSSSVSFFQAMVRETKT